MEEATAQTVLGRFDNAHFAYAGVTSTFFKRNGKFFVRTDGPDGRLSDFEIAYTFGLFPLQQYLIPMPGGRLQALGIAWDARPAAAGGQRWFHLYPNEIIKAGDPLHWTGLRQNWNFMCADCHVTNLRKGYDAGRREYHTTWSEIGVGCESCHGPGSAHVALARSGKGSRSDGYGLSALLDERKGLTWAPNAVTGVPESNRPPTASREPDVCARCHAHRSQLTDDARAGEPLEGAFRVTLLDRPLFHVDGQQHSEVYIYASFLQSKMHARGVTCSDCHDPHTGRLRAQGNATCTRCHLAARYDVPAHTMHAPNTTAAACVTCHMPASTFMVIDERRDHSLRVPRPDRSVSLGVPNACTTACHRAQGAAWADMMIRRRTGRAPDGYQTFPEVFAAADRHAPDAATRLLALADGSGQPAIVRASALSRLRDTGRIDVSAGVRLLSDPDALVRRSAAAIVARADESTRRTTLVPLLSDPIRTVRVEAAMGLMDLADRSLTGADRERFDRAFEEFVAEQRFNGDQPEAQTNLGQALAQRGQLDGALAALQEAIRLDRAFVPAYVDAADIYRERGDESAAERVLRDGLAAAPDSAVVHHVLGLALVRQHRVPDALQELARAATLDPSSTRYAYVYGVALHDNGRAAESIDVLRAAAKRAPDDRDILLALVGYLQQAGRVPEARVYVERALAIDPSDPEVRAVAAALAGPQRGPH